MRNGIILASVVSAIAGFGAGFYFAGIRNGDDARPTVQPDTSRYQQVVDKLRSDNARLVATNRQLAAAPLPVTLPPASSIGFNIGIPAYEEQRAMLNNLRQI